VPHWEVGTTFYITSSGRILHGREMTPREHASVREMEARREQRQRGQVMLHTATCTIIVLFAAIVVCHHSIRARFGALLAALVVCRRLLPARHGPLLAAIVVCHLLLPARHAALLAASVVWCAWLRGRYRPA
jgi:uncharacterized membrane protein YgcG